MSGKQYLKNQLPVILVNLLGMLALALFLIASDNPIQTVLFILASLVDCPCFYLCWHFISHEKNI